MRTTMWENIGVSAKDNSFDNLMKAAGLDYQVETRQLFINDASGSSIEVPGKFATVRTDDDTVLGIVTDRYKVCQNRDALDFVQFIDGIDLIKAGQYNNGAGCYMIGKLPETKVLDDLITPNIIFQNSHDGSGSIRSTICMLRIVCQNQFVRSFSESPATVRMSHMGNLDEKIAVARTQLERTYDYIKCYTEEANDLATEMVTPKKFNEILQHMFDINPENSDRRNLKLEKDRDIFLQAYNADDNQNFVGTKWGLINAYSDVITHTEPSKKTANWEETRFIWYLNPQIMNQFVDFVKAA